MLHSNVSNQHGFTLLESLIVLAIVAILAAMAIPSLLAAQNRAKLSQSTDMVVASLQESQREAIRRNKSCIVTLDKVDNKILGDGGCRLGAISLAVQQPLAGGLVGLHVQRSQRYPVDSSAMSIRRYHACCNSGGAIGCGSGQAQCHWYRVGCWRW